MQSFIEDYLINPSMAVKNASKQINSGRLALEISEDIIYTEISTPEFRLYSEILL